jgi:hypothetical protein
MFIIRRVERDRRMRERRERRVRMGRMRWERRLGGLRRESG